MTASILQELLALYFAIIYNWQLSSSEKSLVEKKNSCMYLKDFTDLDFFFFSFFFYKCLFTLSVMQSIYCSISSQPDRKKSSQPFFLARRHLNTILLTNFENSISISTIFREIHNFLVLADPVIIYIYLRTTGRHFHDQGNVGHPTSKLLKCDLVQALHTFQNTSLRIFAAGKASLVVN